MFQDEYGGFVNLSELVFEEVPGPFDASYGGFDVARTGDNSAVADVVKKGDVFYVRDIAVMKGVKYQD